MRNDTTVIDNESAVKLLAAINEVSGEVIANALATAISRKLGHVTPPLPEDESLPAKFERFFDIIVDVAPVHKAMPLETVIEIVDAAIAGLDKNISEEYDPKLSSDDDLTDMWREDREGYVKMRGLLVEQKIQEAFAVYHNLDTAAREWLNGRDETEEYQLSILLHELRHSD